MDHFIQGTASHFRSSKRSLKHRQTSPTQIHLNFKMKLQLSKTSQTASRTADLQCSILMQVFQDPTANFN